MPILDIGDSFSIDKYEFIKYCAFILAIVFPFPQIKLIRKHETGKDVSSASYVLIMISSILWAVYINIQGYVAYTILSIFVAFNAFLVLCFQFHFYYKRVNEHMLTFDQPPPPPPTIVAGAVNSV